MKSDRLKPEDRKEMHMEQIIYYGGCIRTMDEKGTVEAVLTADGIILAAGTREETEKAAEAGNRKRNAKIQRIPLEGKTMLPAFIDAHSHFSALANTLLQADLGSAESFDDIRHILKEYAANHQISVNGWIRGAGYDHNRLKERVHPDRMVLDEVFPDQPVMISHQSGHVGVFNTKAMELLGITEATPVPEGGTFGRKDGKLTGYMEENAFLKYMKEVPMASMEEFMRAFEEAQKQYASHGITTIQEGMMNSQLLPFYRMLTEKKKLYLDVVVYADIRQREQLKKALGEYRNGYRDHVRLGGYKIFLDGSPQSRTAWMRKPYQGEENGYCGYGTMSDEEVCEAIRTAFLDQMQILAHCNGDAACEQYIRCYEKIRKEFPDQNIRPVMIHAQLLGKDQLRKVKELGIIPSFFVAHVYHWGEIHRKNFGDVRAGEISPCRSAEREGIRFTFHQDTPVIPSDMLETVWCAVNRRTSAGTVLGAEERISVEEALLAVTGNAAWQYGEDDKKGSIAEGKKADFVILDRDPFQVNPEEIREIRVLETIREGKTVYRAEEK